MRKISFGVAVASALLLTASGSCNDGTQMRTPGRIKTLPGLPRPAPLPPPPPGLPPMPARSGELFVIGELTQGGWITGLAPLGARSLTLDGQAVPFEADGRFFAAFDRDAGAVTSLVARLADGRTVARALAIAPRAWQIEHIPLGPRAGTPPDPVFLQRRAGELAQINAARAVNAVYGPALRSAVLIEASYPRALPSCDRSPPSCDTTPSAAPACSSPSCAWAR